MQNVNSAFQTSKTMRLQCHVWIRIDHFKRQEICLDLLALNYKFGVNFHPTSLCSLHSSRFFVAINYEFQPRLHQLSKILYGHKHFTKNKGLLQANLNITWLNTLLKLSWYKLLWDLQHFDTTLKVQWYTPYIIWWAQVCLLPHNWILNRTSRSK